MRSLNWSGCSNREHPMKVKIGDVVEIKTDLGLAYAIYTHRHSLPPRYGALIHVFCRIYPSRPSDIVGVVQDSIRFSTFFPLQAAVDSHVIEIIGNVTVPEHLRNFPLFRAAGLGHLQMKRADDWWLWDGDKEWRVGLLTPEQRKLPIRAVWNYSILVERIVEGWRPEDE